MDYDPIAIWGAGLSTLLAAFEFYKSRISIDTGFSFTGDVCGLGNAIFVRNLTAKPLIVAYFQVQKCRRRAFRWEMIASLYEPDEYFSDIVLEPYSSKTWRFAEADYFSTSLDRKTKEAIILYLVISGRKRPMKIQIV